MRFLKNAFQRRKASPASVVDVVSIYPNRNQKDLVRVHVYKDDFEHDLDDHLSMSRSTSSHSYKQNMPPTSTSSRVTSAGPYCPRRPTLQELLDDLSPAPWTLAAFQKYASQNLCAENIDFVTDAKRYEKYYNDTIDGAVENKSLTAAWERLMQVYIVPNASREINITGDIRKALLSVRATVNAPSPEALKPALKKVYELLEDSILFSFFSDVRPFSTSDEHIDLNMGASRGTPPTASHMPERPPPVPIKSGSDRSSARSRASAPSSSTSSFPHLGRPNTHPANTTNKSHHTSSGSNASGHISFDPALTDDNLSLLSSPSTTTREGTPPHTPPSSEFGGASGKRSNSRGASGDNGNAGSSWRKMGAKLGFRKRSGSQLKDVSEGSNLRSQRDVDGDKDVFDEE